LGELKITMRTQTRTGCDSSVRDQNRYRKRVWDTRRYAQLAASRRREYSCIKTILFDIAMRSSSPIAAMAVGETVGGSGGWPRRSAGGFTEVSPGPTLGHGRTCCILMYHTHSLREQRYSRTATRLHGGINHNHNPSLVSSLETRVDIMISIDRRNRWVGKGKDRGEARHGQRWHPERCRFDFVCACASSSVTGRVYAVSAASEQRPDPASFAHLPHVP
jgi:hypothetical protein